MSKIPLIAVVGPTASGKTRLSVEVALQVGGEIVSADSMQIYKYLNIGTAKPTADEMKGVPHHLMGFLELSQEFSVADYVRLAGEKIKEIHSRGRKAVLCGGTGLYISSLIENIHFSEISSDENLRADLTEKAKVRGAQWLLEQLAEFDADSAKRLHPNDTVRIIRAIEVYKLTGKTMTQHIVESRMTPSPYEARVIGLNCRDRVLLYERINKRVEEMLQTGLLDEAKMLFESNAGKTAMQAIGYKELFPYLRGQVSLSQAVEDLKRETRRYAKRQVTWFKRTKGINWIYIDDYSDFDDVICAAMEIVKT